MTWASPKYSSRMAAYPRSVTWIVVSVGGLAFFLIFASWILISYPIGSTVRLYFYGVGCHFSSFTSDFIYLGTLLSLMSLAKG